MLERDKYKPDTIQQYFPNYSLQKYQQHISGIKPFYKLFFNEKQRFRWDSRFSSTNNIIFSVFLVSLIPVIFHKKMPVLKNYTSKKARLFWGLGLIFIPSNIVGALLGQSTQGEVSTSYNIKLQDFKRYRQNKDITQVNPQIRFSEY